MSCLGLAMQLLGSVNYQFEICNVSTTDRVPSKRLIPIFCGAGILTMALCHCCKQIAKLHFAMCQYRLMTQEKIHYYFLLCRHPYISFVPWLLGSVGMQLSFVGSFCGQSLNNSPCLWRYQWCDRHAQRCRF